MKNKIIIGTLLCSAVVILTFSATNDGHRTNLRYLAWKWGLTKYTPEVSLRYLNVDTSFVQSLNGQSKSEVKKLFPDLRTEMKPEQYLDQSNPFYITSPDFLWIGDSPWAIEFQQEKVIRISLIKGCPRLEDRRAF